MTFILNLSLLAKGGYGLYLTGMGEQTYKVVGREYPRNRAKDVKNPALGCTFSFLFAINFQGIFVLVPLRKVLQHILQWFFNGGGEAICGFDNFLSLGMTTFTNTFLRGYFYSMFSCSFYFDFLLPLIGSGMICPLIVDCSIMFGVIISWGVMWPLIQKRVRDWYPEDSGSKNFWGLFRY